MSGADIQRLVAEILLWAGVVVAAGSGLALLALRHRTDRIHALTPLTTLAAPLIALSLAVDLGHQRLTFKVLFIGALVALTGGVLASATGDASRSPGNGD